MTVLAEGTIDMNLENLKNRVVVSDESVDIVDTDGNILASYGASAEIFGTNAKVEVYSNGLSIKDGDENVYFDVHKTSADDEVVEKATVTIADYDQEKTATLGSNFTTITKVELIGNTSGGASGTAEVLSETSGGDSGIFLDANGLRMGSWSISGNVVTVSSYNVATTYRTKFARNEYRIKGIRFTGNCPAQTVMMFNGVEIDYPLQEGKSNGWNYRKMASGILECWQTFDWTGKIATSQASEYCSAAITLEDYPIPFASWATVSLNVSCDSSDHGFARIVNYPVASPKTNVGTMRLNRQNAMSTSTTFLISVFVKGRWK